MPTSLPASGRAEAREPTLGREVEGEAADVTSDRFEAGWITKDWSEKRTKKIFTVMEEEEEEARVEERRGAPAPDKFVTFTLTDTDVLDCAVCFEPLKSPTFQVHQFFLFTFVFPELLHFQVSCKLPYQSDLVCSLWPGIEIEFL